MNTLVQLAPLPDELDRGYLGRIMRMNGYRNAKDAAEAISIHFGEEDKTRRELTTHELLSKMAGQSTEQFARYHTTIPLRRAITSFFPEIRHGSLDRQSLLHNGAIQRKYAAAFFCRACVSADIDFHGISYWRREHQTPGQLWCANHKEPLHYTTSPDPFLLSTAQFVGHGDVVPADLVRAARENQLVQRFLDISSGVYDRGMPLSVPAIAPLLKDVGKLQGFQTYAGPVKMALVSDRIRRLFPEQWLATVFRGLVEKKEATFMPQVDGTLYMRKSSSSVTAYFLVLAVLYESADEALNALSAACEGTYVSQVLRRRTPHEIPDHETLLQFYITAKGCHSQVAKALLLPQYVVTAALEPLGLPHISSRSVEGQQVVLAALASFYVNGNSFSESAKASKLAGRKFELLLRKCGPNMTRALSKICPQGAPRPRSQGSKMQLPGDMAILRRYQPEETAVGAH
jgi:hypothetical protein